MHWRPDAITSTSVIQPMWIRQLSPVDMATHTVDPFVTSVRGRGPAVSPYPSSEDVAYAAGKLAQLFARGQTGVVCAGTEKIRVDANTPPSGGIVGIIIQAAQQLMRGGPVKIQIGSRAVMVCNSGPNGEPAITPTNGAAPAITPANGAASPAQPTSMTVGPTSGLGQMQEVLPKVPPPGHVPQQPFLDYAFTYRKLNYDDNVWGRRNFQASIASRFAPNAIAATNAVASIPVRDAQRQVDPALASRAPMVMRRWPHPEAVWPHQAHMVHTRRGGR